MFYLAYGSNMDTHQMHERCRSARAVGAATLPGMALAFRRGVGPTGVATVVPAEGAVVRGRLWTVTEADLAALDRREGVGLGVYRRTTLRVQVGAHEVDAEVYLLVDEHAAAALPSPLYLERIAAGWRACGWPVPDLVEEAGLHPVFVYGTLKRGESNSGLLEDAAGLGEAAVRGLLGDLGPYPVLAAVGRSLVHGELYAVDGRTLARLDRLEGHPAHYQRVRLPLREGGEVWVYTQDPERVRQLPRVVDGRWSRARVAGMHQHQMDLG